MYCKLFASLYQGTLRGRSNEILVFTNLLAHAGRDGTVDKHFRAIAEETGLSMEEVKEAIEVLESPDPESRSPEENGARIVRMDEHRVWGWKIVNYGKYRAIRSEEDRAEQNRLAQQRWRDHNKQSKPASATSKQDKPKEREEGEGDGKAEPPIRTRPAASPQKGVKEGKDSAMIPTTPQSKRFAAIFHRLETTPWADNEVSAYKKLGTVPDDDLEAVERYYAANWPPKRDHNILRHNLITFLNNFPSEVDRAKAMKSKTKNGHSFEWSDSTPKAAPLDPAEDERLRAEAKRHAENFRKGLA